MAAIVLSNAGRSVGADAIGAAMKYIDIYDSPRPATPDTAITSQIKLARVTLNATPFAAASNGVAAASAIAATTGLATGTAAWCRILASDGTTVIADGDVGTSGQEVNLSTTSIESAGAVTITSGSLTQTA